MKNVRADYFERRVEEVIDRLPERFREAARNINIIVEDEPSPEILADVDDDSDEPLLGLYVGTPLTERSFGEVPALPDRIYIFRGPLERSSRSRRELSEQIRITVLHELAHYFGFDDEYLFDVGYD
jgi:predicted Zn-dependent protease with MMP-like domain